MSFQWTTSRAGPYLFNGCAKSWIISELIVCAAHGQADLPNIEKFSAVQHKVALWYPERLDSELLGVRFHSAFSPAQLQACGVTIQMLDYVHRQVDTHVALNA